MECLPIHDVLKKYDITKEELLAIANDSGVFVSSTDTQICLTSFLKQQLDKINETLSLLNRVGWVTRSIHGPSDIAILTVLKRKGVTIARKGSTAILSKMYVSPKYDDIAKMPSEIKRQLVYIEGIPFLRVDLYEKFLKIERSRKETIVIDVTSETTDEGRK